MDNNETTFYLGEKKPEPEPAENPYRKGPRISYGGDMPLVFSDEEYVPLTNDEVEKNRAYSEMLEKKNMINRRMLYLEKRKMELLGYYMKIEKNDKGRNIRSFAKTLLVILGVIIVLMLGMLDKRLAVAGAIAFIAMALFIYNRYSSENPDGKLNDLDNKMTAMEDEHKMLEREKEELLAKIQEYRDKEHI